MICIHLQIIAPITIIIPIIIIIIIIIINVIIVLFFKKMAMFIIFHLSNFFGTLVKSAPMHYLLERPKSRGSFSKLRFYHFLNTDAFLEILCERCNDALLQWIIIIIIIINIIIIVFVIVIIKITIIIIIIIIISISVVISVPELIDQTHKQWKDSIRISIRIIGVRIIIIDSSILNHFLTSLTFDFHNQSIHELIKKAKNV